MKPTGRNSIWKIFQTPLHHPITASCASAAAYQHRTAQIYRYTTLHPQLQLLTSWASTHFLLFLGLHHQCPHPKGKTSLFLIIKTAPRGTILKLLADIQRLRGPTCEDKKWWPYRVWCTDTWQKTTQYTEKFLSRSFRCQTWNLVRTQRQRKKCHVTSEIWRVLSK